MFKKIVRENFFNKLNFLFVLVYVISLEISQLAFFHNFAYTLLINAFLGVTALSIFVYNVFVKKQNFKILNYNYTWFLLLFTMLCVVSILTNISYGLRQNIFSLFGIFSNFYFLYNFAYEKEKEEIDKYIKILFNAISDIWCIFVLIALYMYMFQISFHIEVDNEIFLQGFSEQRLFGLFLNMNVAAIVSLVVIIYKVFTYKKVKNKIYKTFCGINIVCEYLYVILSASRAAYYGMLLAIVFIVYFIAREFLKVKYKKILLEAFCITIGFLGVVLNVLLYRGIESVLSYVPSVVDMLSFDDSKEEILPMEPSKKGSKKKGFKQIELARDDYKENNDVSNNRFKIWKNTYEIIKVNAVFGISPKNLDMYLRYTMPSCYLAESKYRNIHNGFIELFLFTGLTGGLTMCAFLILCVIKILKFLFGENINNNENYLEVLMFSSCFLVLSFASATTASFCFDRVMFAPLFWLSLGFTMYYIGAKRSCSRKE